jgi:hypothetical protein
MRDKPMTLPANEKLVEIFFRHFNYDNSKFLLPRMPYYDGFQHRRVMDYAIISKDPSMPKVAIIIKPEYGYRNRLGEIELENSLRALEQLGWIPLVFTSSDFEVRSGYVRARLEMIFCMASNRASRKAKPKGSLRYWFNGLSFPAGALSRA